MCGHPRSLGSSAAWLSLLLVVVFAGTGCRAPGSGSTPEDSPVELGAEPLPLEEQELPAAPVAGTPAPTQSPPEGTTNDEGTAPADPPADGSAPGTEPGTESPTDPDEDPGATPPVSPDPPPPPPPAGDDRPERRVVGSAADAHGDQGLEGPDYADILAVTIEEEGALARVIIDMAADIPARLGEGEVMGVGVDLWRDPSRTESDFQLFADGGTEGWLAYLHTPTGFVEYPGEFRLGGRRMVFEVPWSALGGMTSGGFRAFADWSQSRLIVNAASRDHAPDRTPAPFAR